MKIGNGEQQLEDRVIVINKDVDTTKRPLRQYAGAYLYNGHFFESVEVEYNGKIETLWNISEITSQKVVSYRCKRTGRKRYDFSHGAAFESFDRKRDVVEYLDDLKNAIEY